MAFDDLLPEVQDLLGLFEQMGLKDFPDMTPDEARQTFTDLRVADEAKPEVHHVEDRVLPRPGGEPEVPVRIYRPSDEPNLAVLVWLHGGGWVLGDLETGDLPARDLCNRAQCAVVSVDYRLAPEAPFPAAYDDSQFATQWVIDNATELGFDPGRIAVGGDSAGGNLAACVAATTKGLCFQLLVYPVIAPDFTTESYTQNETGYFLTKAGMEWFWNQYTSPADHDNPQANPLKANLAGLPPAWIFTITHDPLCDDGKRYAAALKDAGVEVEYYQRDDVIHGVFAMTLACSPELRAEAARVLVNAFS